MTTLNQVADVLDAAADLIKPEGAWTRNADARDAHGNDVDALSEAAVCWCLDGAYIRAGGEWADHGWRILSRLVPGDVSPITWNDNTATQEEVVETLRKAAQSARKDSK